MIWEEAIRRGKKRWFLYLSLGSFFVCCLLVIFLGSSIVLLSGGFSTHWPMKSRRGESKGSNDTVIQYMVRSGLVLVLNIIIIISVEEIRRHVTPGQGHSVKLDN